MKNHLYIILCCLILMLGCNTRKQFVNQDRFCEFDDNIPKSSFVLTDSMLVLLRKYSQIMLIDTKKSQEKVFYREDLDTLVLKLVKNKKTNISKNLYYNLSGVLKISSFIYGNHSLPIGKANFYNRFGEITKVEDDGFSDKYPICFKEAIRLVERKIGKKDSVFGINKAKRERSLLDTLYHWDVFVREPIKNKKPKTWLYRINAENGILIDKLKVVSNPS